MKRLLERFEAMAMAVAFAEAGEWETAKEFMEKKRSQKSESKRTALPNSKQRSTRPRVRM